MRVALVNAPLVSAVSDHGMGRQMAPGLLMVGGALLGRVAVTRIDAARDHLPAADAVRSSNYFGGLRPRHQNGTLAATAVCTWHSVSPGILQGTSLPYPVEELSRPHITALNSTGSSWHSTLSDPCRT
jgi:hypothetical protein